jgi:hypothetical protein
MIAAQMDAVAEPFIMRVAAITMNGINTIDRNAMAGV